MLSFYDSRSLTHKLNIPLARYKRWTREFLPPDNLGGYQSGYARQYNVNEAFLVYLGGFLVHDVKLTMTQAKDVLAHMTGRLPNLYSSINRKELEQFKLALILDNGGTIYGRLSQGVRLLYEDEAFDEKVDCFVRVVLVGKLVLKFVDNLNA